jgi:hypothetical protein
VLVVLLVEQKVMLCRKGKKHERVVRVKGEDRIQLPYGA